MTRRGPTIKQRYWCSRTKRIQHRIVRQFVKSKNLKGAPRVAMFEEAERLFRRA